MLFNFSSWILWLPQRTVGIFVSYLWRLWFFNLSPYPASKTAELDHRCTRSDWELGLGSKLLSLREEIQQKKTYPLGVCSNIRLLHIMSKALKISFVIHYFSLIIGEHSPWKSGRREGREKFVKPNLALRRWQTHFYYFCIQTEEWCMRGNSTFKV